MKRPMRKYKCPNCEEVFDEDEVDRERSDEYEEFWGFRVRNSDIYWYCPYCGEQIDDTCIYHEEDEKEEDDDDKQ